MPKRRLAIARLWYEANSFSPLRTDLAAFQAREWVSGDEARAFYAGTGTEIGGVLAVEPNHPDWEFHYLHCAAAPPGGLVEPAAFAIITQRILAGLGEQTWDAVYLSLHGAMATVDDPTPEFHLLQAVRETIGATPLAASFDLHAHLSAEMAALLDATSGYHTYPHIDMDEAAKRALALLVAEVEGRAKPKIAVAKVPAIMPSFNMRTADGPMAELQQLAGMWRRQRGMLDVTVYGGFAYGDSPFAGPSIVAVAEKDEKLAQRCAKALAAEFLKRKQQFYIRLPRPADGLQQAIKTEGAGPAIVLDPADNPLSGGIGDTPAVFQALLDSKPAAGSVFAFFWDPDLVDECYRLGVGASIEAKLGGRITQDFGPPVVVTAKILRLTDGKFRNEGPYEHNLAVDVGRTAVIETGNVRVIVTSSCQAPNDPAYFRLHGIEPKSVPLLCVKAKNHFRAAFADMARCLIDVDAPGPASAGLFHYKFHHAPQHIW
ncbi:MAG TPA: M81 family metallopeptidase [Dongiaceae bacterium]